MFIASALAAALLQVPDVEAQGRVTDVDVRGNAFIPGSITVLVGTTVTWTQRDMIEHTVTVDDNQPEEWDQGVLLPANQAGLLNTFEHTFEKLGTTAYHCEIHANMIGEVTVVESFDSSVVTVNANDANEFNPELVEINVTEGILWINSGTLQHTVTFEDESIGEVAILQENEQARLNFTTPGSYRYRCTYHSGDDFETGMVGKIVVGGNATFPTVLIIDEPTNGTAVNATFNVTGRLIHGQGQPAVTGLEYRIDESANWTDINKTDLPEFQWTFTIDARDLSAGNHTIVVRALADEAEAATETVTVTAARPAPPAAEKGGTPGTPVVWVLLVLSGLAAVRPGRHFR